MLVKVHESYRYVVAICDSDLIDKKFEEGNRQLDLTTGFFKGDEQSREQVVEIIEDMKREDATFNIVGKEAVGLALETGLVVKEGVIHISGIPIALVLL